MHFAVSNIAAVAAGIKERAGVAGFHIRPVVVAADEPVHTLHQVERIQGFGLKDGSVSLAAGRVHGGHHYVRVLLGAHEINIFLDTGSN